MKRQDFTILVLRLTSTTKIRLGPTVRKPLSSWLLCQQELPSFRPPWGKINDAFNCFPFQQAIYDLLSDCYFWCVTSLLNRAGITSVTCNMNDRALPSVVLSTLVVCYRGDGLWGELWRKSNPKLGNQTELWSWTQPWQEFLSTTLLSISYRYTYWVRFASSSSGLDFLRKLTVISRTFQK